MTQLREGTEPSLDAAALGRLGIDRRGAGPRSLLVHVGAVLAGLAIMLTFLAVGAASSRTALNVIGHESGPQVVATADLYFALSDADTQVATVLLLGDSEAARAAAALEEYARLRGDIAEYLLQAHRLAGNAETQRETIESIMSGYGAYEQLAAEALLLAQQTAYPPGEAPENVLVAYRAAADMMSRQILPLAYNLTLENGTIVREAHDVAQGRIAFAIVAVALSGVVALASLAWLQIHLARSFRRVFSPSLLVATAVAGLYLFTGLMVLDAERDALSGAKTEGFDAALSLARATAISNSLHADQIRYLLDTGEAVVYEQTYFDKAQQLVYVESGNLDQYLETLEGTSGSGAVPGLIGAGLDGSPQARAVAESYVDLMRADTRMRSSLEAPADRIAPVDAALGAYEADLDALSQHHLDTFAAAIDDGERAIADFGFLLPAAMVSLTVFTFSGIAPRIREFR